MDGAVKTKKNGLMQVSPQYILRSDITAQDVTQYKIKIIGILTSK
jgi:hypothetical protein